MFNPESDSAFVRHLRRTQALNGRFDGAVSRADLQQWLEYWNDAETVATNLRRFEHWLQRAAAAG